MYIATVANNEPVIVNATTGAILKTRENHGRKTIKLYYNGKQHSHNFAHAWECIANGWDLATMKAMHVHHIDGDKTNDVINNWLPCCERVHIGIHQIMRTA